MTLSTFKHSISNSNAVNQNNHKKRICKTPNLRWSKPSKTSKVAPSGIDDKEQKEKEARPGTLSRKQNQDTL